jgi:hypothetical protein
VTSTQRRCIAADLDSNVKKRNGGGAVLLAESDQRGCVRACGCMCE